MDITAKSLLLAAAAAGSVAGGTVLVQSEPEKKHRDRKENLYNQVTNHTQKPVSNNNNSLETNSVEIKPEVVKTESNEPKTVDNTISQTTPEQETVLASKEDSSSKNDVNPAPESEAKGTEASLEKKEGVTLPEKTTTDVNEDKSKVSEESSIPATAPKEVVDSATTTTSDNNVKGTDDEGTSTKLNEASQLPDNSPELKLTNNEVDGKQEHENPSSTVEQKANLGDGAAQTQATSFFVTSFTSEIGPKSVGNAQVKTLLQTYAAPSTISENQIPVGTTSEKNVSPQKDTEDIPPTKEGPLPVVEQTPPNFSAQLSFGSENFYQDFNKPGDCIKRMFPKIETYSVFKLPKSINNQVFNAYNHNDTLWINPSSFACYTFNKKDNQDVRVEFSFTNQEKAWIWMSGTKLNENTKKIWYREIYLKKEPTYWKVLFGQDGEIPYSDDNFFDYSDDWDSSFPLQEVNAETQKDCLDNCPIKARLGYWKYSDTESETITKHFSKIDGQIIPLKQSKTGIYPKGSIKQFYDPTGWNEIFGYMKSEYDTFLQLNLQDLKNRKGAWTNLVGFCENPNSNLNDKKIFCKP